MFAKPMSWYPSSTRDACRAACAADSDKESGVLVDWLDRVYMDQRDRVRRRSRWPIPADVTARSESWFIETVWSIVRHAIFHVEFVAKVPDVTLIHPGDVPARFPRFVRRVGRAWKLAREAFFPIPGMIAPANVVSTEGFVADSMSASVGDRLFRPGCGWGDMSVRLDDGSTRCLADTTQEWEVVEPWTKGNPAAVRFVGWFA